jgi:hypothetical protein
MDDYKMYETKYHTENLGKYSFLGEAGLYSEIQFFKRSEKTIEWYRLHFENEAQSFETV